MSSVAKLKYFRTAPRKVRLVADLIRGKTVPEAQTILKFTVKKSAQPLLKLLNQAVANAKQQKPHLLPENLYIAKITVDEGPKLKRWRPRARGQAYEIQKKSSHINLVLEEIPLSKKKIQATQPFISEAEKPKEIKEKPKEESIKKPKPKIVKEVKKPKIERAIKKIFRRKSF